MPPQIAEQKIKHLFAYISDNEKAIDEQNHRITFTVSTELLDRHGDIVEASAVLEAIKRPGEFSANPVALACHLHRLSDGMPPAIGSWDIASANLFGNQVQMDLIFAIDTKLGNEYWKLYSQRHMRAVSIGFSVLDFRQEKDAYRILKIELYEISCVAVGANPQALSKLLEKYYQPDRDTGDNFADKEKPDPSNYMMIHLSKAKLMFTMLEIIKSKLESLEEGFDEIKSLLITDQDKLAEKLLLGRDSDSLGPAGDSQISEQIVKNLEEIKVKLSV